MKLSEFLNTWRGVSLENRISRLALAILSAAVLLQAWQIGRVERTVVLIPPQLSGPVDLSRNSASREAREAWALYVAQLLGNVTPATGEFMMQTLEPLLAGNLRRMLLDLIADQLEDIRREDVSMRFEPREVAYEENTQTVYISGTHTTEGPGAAPVKAQRTYEVRVDYSNYRPLVTHLDVYPGAPQRPSQKEQHSVSAD